MAGLAALTCGQISAHDNDTQLWLTGSASHRFDAATSLGLELSERLRTQRVGGNQWLGRVTVTRRIAPGVDVSLGLGRAASAGVTEIRPEEALTLTHGGFSLRSRLEERMIDNLPTTQLRLRERLQFSLPAGRDWTLTAAGELFFQLNRTKASDVTGLNAFRAQIGVRRSLGKSWNLSLLYQRHQTIKPGKTDAVSHAPAISLARSF